MPRNELVAAIARGLDNAARSESRRTMERSLLIDYIADAVEAALPDVTTQHTCTPDVGAACVPCGISAEQALKGKRVANTSGQHHDPDRR